MWKKYLILFLQHSIFQIQVQVFFQKREKNCFYFKWLTSEQQKNPDNCHKIKLCNSTDLQVDTWTGRVLSYLEDQLYMAEPAFVARPTATEEDDGVLVASAIRGAPEVNYTALVVLEAKTMKQIARSEFRLGGPVPKPLHGYFTGNNKFAR